MNMRLRADGKSIDQIFGLFFSLSLPFLSCLFSVLRAVHSRVSSHPGTKYVKQSINVIPIIVSSKAEFVPFVSSGAYASVKCSEEHPYEKNHDHADDESLYMTRLE